MPVVSLDILCDTEPPGPPAGIATLQRLADGPGAMFGSAAENVRVIFEPAARGRIAFGGVLVR